MFRIQRYHRGRRFQPNRIFWHHPDCARLARRPTGRDQLHPPLRESSRQIDELRVVRPFVCANCVRVYKYTIEHSYARAYTCSCICVSLRLFTCINANAVSYVRLRACVCVRAFACVCVRVFARRIKTKCVCAQNISTRKRTLGSETFRMYYTFTLLQQKTCLKRQGKCVSKNTYVRTCKVTTFKCNTTVTVRSGTLWVRSQFACGTIHSRFIPAWYS